jgi:excisionase family DNA binding protein
MSSNIKIQRICKQCNGEFTARTTVTMYCSHKCTKAAYKARLRNEKIESSNNETRQIKLKPIEDLKAKPYLSINEASALLGISRRTMYRMINRGEINIGKAGKRTIIRITDIEKLFELPVKIEKEPIIDISNTDISECYSMTEMQSKFGISEKALYEVIKRNNIPKFKKGWYSYVPKTAIEKILI